MRKFFALIAAFVMALGIGTAVAPSASASADGNYAQPWQYATCGNTTFRYSIHYNHEHAQALQERAYAIFVESTSGPSGVNRLITYVADPSYTYGWETVDDTYIGGYSEFARELSYVVHSQSTGRLRVTVYTTAGSVCTHFADGSSLFGQS